MPAGLSKRLSIINEAKKCGPLKFITFPYDLTNVGNMVSGTPSSSESGLLWREFSLKVLSESLIQDVQQDFTCMRY